MCSVQNVQHPRTPQPSPDDHMTDDQIGTITELLDQYSNFVEPLRGTCPTLEENREITRLCRSIQALIPHCAMKHALRRGRLVVLCRRDGPTCYYCQAPLDFNPGLKHHPPSRQLKKGRWRATFDHVVPRAKGGTSHLSNLRLSCQPCNSRKGDQDVAD